MTKPMLQIALDSTDLATAVDIADRVAGYVEVIEVGTILAFAEGMSAVRTMRERHPDHIIVCDMKTTDGGAILARMAFSAGADWITVSAARTCRYHCCMQESRGRVWWGDPDRDLWQLDAG